jgi:uncharacterized protein YcfL
MKTDLFIASLLMAASLMQPATAQEAGSAASKVMLRGEPNGVKVDEIRAARRADVLVVEADMRNTEVANRQVFYRFKWLDAGGMQVGDGESWKQLVVYGQQVAVVKSVAPSSKSVDFRIEMNVEK